MGSWTERHLVNRAMRAAARLGRDIDGIREVEVLGRRSGRPRRTPLKVLEVDGTRYLVSLYGNSGWVHNLRAQGSARLRLGRHVEDVVVTELSDQQKPPIVRAYLAAASRKETRQRLMLAAEGVTDEDTRRGTAQVPVFRLTPARRNAPPAG